MGLRVWLGEFDVVRSLKINLVRRSHTHSLLGWLLLTTGVLVLGIAVLDLTSAKERGQAVQASLTQKTRISRPQITVQPLIKNAEGKKSQQRAMEHLDQPWALWFSALEQLNDTQVALLSVDMKGSPAQARLTAESRSMSQALVYLEKLRGSPRVKSAVLSSHEAIRIGEVNVIRFTIDFSWSTRP